MPRIAAIEHPFGTIVGQPGDHQGQMAVVRAVFQALETIDTPGSVEHLPFTWPGSDKRSSEVHEPPITVYLKKNIRQVLRFVRRDIPPEFRV